MPQFATILTIGDEILLGHILDTNAQFISKTLSAIGIDIKIRFTVGDTRADMESAIRYAFEHTDVLIVTGGLGPTKDDLTKPVLASWFKSEIETNPRALEHLESLLRRRGREMNALTRTQADQPVKAEYIHNQVGTAPGMWFSENGKICIALPGVPYEMKQMLVDEVVPRLQNRLKLQPILHQFIRTIGIPESSLAERIAAWEAQLPAHLKLAYLPSGGQVKLRLTGRGSEEAPLQADIQEQTRRLLPLIEDVVYATEDVEIEEVLTRMLLHSKPHIVLEDEITKGALSFRIKKSEFLGAALERALPSKIAPEELWFVLKTKCLENNEAGADQELIVEMHTGFSAEPKVSTRPMRSFPSEQVNQNMVSLWILEMMRKQIVQTQLPN